MGNSKASREKYNEKRRAMRALQRKAKERAVIAAVNDGSITDEQRKKYSKIIKDSHKKTGQFIAEHDSQNTTPALPVLTENNEKLSHGKMSDIIHDLRQLQESEPDKFITRNFYRNNGLYSEKAWKDLFGTFEEFKRCAGIEVSRGAHRIDLNTSHHAARDRYRGFQEIEIDPYIGKYERPSVRGGYRRVVVASDFHGPNVDKFAIDVLLDTIHRCKPDIVCLAGDVFDMYDFSRFDRDPRQSNLEYEFEFVKKQILGKIRESAGNDCQIDFILGNHENRMLRHLADKTPYLKVLMSLMGQSMSSLMGLDDYKINLVSRYDLAAHQPKERREEMAKNYKVYYDALTVHHGDSRNNRFRLCNVFGHTHKPSFVTDVHERDGSIWSMCLGSMASVDLEYVDGLNRYENGFGIVHIDTDTKTCVAEPVIFSNGMAVVGGKVYTR